MHREVYTLPKLPTPRVLLMRYGDILSSAEAEAMCSILPCRLCRVDVYAKRRVCKCRNCTDILQLISPCILLLNDLAKVYGDLNLPLKCYVHESSDSNRSSLCHSCFSSIPRFVSSAYEFLGQGSLHFRRASKLGGESQRAYKVRYASICNPTCRMKAYKEGKYSTSTDGVSGTRYGFYLLCRTLLPS